MAIKQIAPYAHLGTTSGALMYPSTAVQPLYPELVPGKYPKLEGQPLQLSNGAEIAPWGGRNNHPEMLRKLLDDSNIAPQMLLTKIDFAVGEKLFAYEEDLVLDPKTDQLKIIKVPIKNPLLQKWLNGLKADQLMRKRATDYYFSGNALSTMVTARDPERYGIAFIDHIDSMYGRAEVINKTSRRIEHYYICDDWSKPVYSQKGKGDDNVKRFKAFREDDPLKYFRSIHHSKIYWPGQIYYGTQPWHSGKKWIGFANKIPVWMDANISNSSNIKYHIQYPADYFSYTDSWKEEDRKKEMDRVFNQFDEWLAGAPNAGKTFYSKQIIDPMTGQAVPGWAIEPIKNDIQDKAWVEAYKTSQGALTSTMGINPALADIPTEGKFTTSGSELRIAYQIHIALKVQAARAIMVEPLEIAYKINHDIGVPGFENPDLKFGFINRNVVTLADDKGGTQQSAE